MRHPAPDRDLSRAVTTLAGLHPDDLALILDALEPRERALIDVLIGTSGRTDGQTVGEAEPVWSYEGVSPWLRVRIDPGAQKRGEKPEFILMTDAARAALVAAAAPFRTAAATPGPGPSLMGRIWGRLKGSTT